MLFTPLTLKSHSNKTLTLKNRIVMPPMDMFAVSTDDGMPSPFHTLHYAARALGGTGLIIIEATAISRIGRLSDGCIGLWNKEQLERHKEIVDAVHQNGAKIAVQLNHSGRKNGAKDATGQAPSNIPFSQQYANIKALDISGIDAIKADFIAASKLAKQAGYDAIEVHAAHGYLLSSFLSPLSNTRSDVYGGSLENRARLLYEVVEGIESAIDLPVFVRLGATCWEVGGFDIIEAIEVAKGLEARGVALLDISAGGNIAEPSLMPKIAPLYQCGYSKEIKEALNIPVTCVGLITTGAIGEALLLGGVADLICYGRALLANPNLPYVMAHELGCDEEILPSYRRGFYAR